MNNPSHIIDEYMAHTLSLLFQMRSEFPRRTFSKDSFKIFAIFVISKPEGFFIETVSTDEIDQIIKLVTEIDKCKIPCWTMLLTKIAGIFLKYVVT